MDEATYPIIIDPTVVATWQSTSLNEQKISATAVSPGFATDSTVFAATPSSIYKSIDGGVTWVPKTNGLGETEIKALALSPAFSNDGTVIVATRNRGIYRSTDRAESWTKLIYNSYIKGADSLALSPNFALDRTMFAGVGGNFGGVYKSSDNGLTWQKVFSSSYPHISSIAISSGYQSDQTLFFAVKEKVYKSTDGGVNWLEVTPPNAVSVYSLALSPNYLADQTVFAGTNNYTYKSIDGGVTWSQNTIGVNKKVNVVAISPDFASDQSVMAGTKADEFPQGVFQSFDAGTTWQSANPGLSATEVFSLALAPDFYLNGIAFVGTDRGIFKTMDSALPVSNILIPENGSTLTASLLTIIGSANDDLTVAKVQLAVIRDSDGYYFDDINSTWTVEPIWNEATIVANRGSTSADWQYDWRAPLDTGGYYTIKSKAVDGRNNSQEYPSTINIAVDNVTPEGSISINQGDTFTKEKTVALSNTIIYADRMRFSLDSGLSWSDWESYASSKELTLSSGDGTKTVQAEFMRSSNGKVLRASDEIILDTEAPEIVIISPVNGDILSAAATIFADVNDAISGVEKVTFSVNGQPIGELSAPPYEIVWDTTAYLDQTYQLKVTAYDRLGNTSENEITVQIVNNTVSPDGGIFNSSDRFVSLEFPPLAVGETIKINYLKESDRLVPGFSYAGSFFELTAETLSGEEVSNFNFPYLLTINDVPDIPNLNLYYLDLQQNKWRLVESQIANGKLTATLDHFTLFALLADTEAPVTQASLNKSETPSGWLPGDTLVTLNATDGGSGVASTFYQWDSTESVWQNYESPINALGGTHLLYFYSLDAAGNREEIKSLLLKVDNTPPVINSFSAESLIVGSLEIVLNSDVTDAAYMRIAQDTSTLSGMDYYSYNPSVNFTLTAGDGPKTIYAQFKDENGNETQPISINIIFETPAVPDNYSADPSIIASVVSGGTGTNSQRKTFYDGQNYWAFYQDGLYVKYISSPDGTNWNLPATFPGRSKIGDSNKNARDVSVVNRGNDVYAVFNSSVHQDPGNIFIRKGVISGTVINWQTAYIALQGNDLQSYQYPFITLDANGKIWVSAKTQAYQNGAWVAFIRAVRSLNPDDPSGWEAPYDLSDTSNTYPTVFSSLAPLADGQIYAVWQKNNYVEGRLFDGNSWQPVVLIGDTGDPPSLVADNNDKIYVAFKCVYSTPHQLWYRSANFPYAASDWSARTPLSSEGANQRYTSLSLDSAANKVYAFYAEIPFMSNGTRIRFKRLGDSYSTVLSPSSERAFDKVTAYSALYGTLTDVTAKAADYNYADVKNASSGNLLAAVGDYIYVGMSEKFNSISYSGTTASGITLTLSYWNGSAWSELGFTDSTNNLSRGGDLSFTPPADWQQKEDGYYYIAIGTSTQPSTAPIGTEITAYKRYSGITSNYSAAGKVFAIWTEAGSSPYDIYLENPDIVAPETLITAPAAGSILGGASKLIMGTFTDNVSVSGINISIQRQSDAFYWDGSNSVWTADFIWNDAVITSGFQTVSGDWQYNWRLPEDNGGVYTIRARAVDSFGNIEQSPEIIYVNIDTVSPETTLETFPTVPNGDNGWFKTAPTITLTSNEPGSTYYQWDSTETGNWVTFTGSFAGLEGEHTLYYYSTDAAGNAEAIKERLIMVDTSWSGTGFYMTRVSVNSLGMETNNSNSNPSVSADGRFVVFQSSANNLVVDDTNNMDDIFRKDLSTGEIVRVSVDAADLEANGHSFNPSMSADGRFVAFNSYANNLVPGDSNGVGDVFRKDLVTGEIVRVSVSSTGAEANSYSSNPSISSDGRFVVFQSAASNLVVGDTNNANDIFRKDLQTGEIVRVSITLSGNQVSSSSYKPSVSSDGRFVAFYSAANNLVLGDTNGRDDIFRKDLLTGDIVRVSVSASGAQSDSYSYDPVISTDGRFVTFRSLANNLVTDDTNGKYDIFRKDLATGEIIRVSIGSTGSQTNNHSYTPSISADSRFIAFGSLANNLVTDDTNGKYDIFRKDLLTGEIIRISVDKSGTEANNDSSRPSISADGRFVVFYSPANNLVQGDTNVTDDIFLADIEYYPYPDTIPPVTTVNTSPIIDGENGWFKTIPSITLTIDEPGITFYNWDSTSWMAYSGAFSGLEGKHTLYYYSIDLKANNEIIKNQSILVDTGLPSAFNLLSPADGTLTNTNLPTFSWGASSDLYSGLAKYQLYIDDVLNREDIDPSARSISPSSPLADGSHTWYVKAVDNAGNARQSTATRTINIDTTPPLVLDFGINSNAEYTNSRNVALNNNVNGASFMRFAETTSALSQATYQLYDASLSFALSDGDGTKTIYAQYKDSAGNETEPGVIGTVSTIILDTTAPEVSAVIPPDSAYVHQDTIITVDFNEANEMDTSTINGNNLFIVDSDYIPVGADVSYDPIIKRAVITPLTYLSQGSFSGYLTNAVMDKAGNRILPYSWNFNAAAVVPLGSVISDPTGGIIAGANKLITGFATDNEDVSTVTLAIRRQSDLSYWNGSETTWTAGEIWNSALITSGLHTSLAAWQYNWLLPADDDTYTIEAKAVNGLGGVQAVPSQVVVRVENSIPTGSITINNDAQFTNDTSVTIQNNIIDAAFMRFSADGGDNWSSWENFASSKELALPAGDGTKTVKAQFKKYQSSTNVLNVNDSIVLDTQAPVTGIIAPANENEVVGVAEIRAIADDALSGTAKVQFYANDELIGEDTSVPYEISWDTADEINGPSILYVTAVDMLGNTIESTPVEVEVNNPIPFVPAKGIKDWLLLGTFNNPNDSTRLSADYINGENIIKPSAGDNTSGRVWTSYTSETETIDLTGFTGDSTDAVTYANTYVYSPVDNAAQLRFGSTDGIKIWLNGEAVFQKDEVRDFVMDDDSATVGLNAGWNRILVKISHNNSSENKFNLKVADTDGGEIPGLTYQLDNPEPAILFEDNFNQETTAPAAWWQTYNESSAKIESNQLRSTAWFITSDPMPQPDYRYELDTIFYPNSDNNISTGLMFRAADINNGYEFNLTNEGVAFYKKVSGSLTQIGPSVPFKLETGKNYHVEITARGNTFFALIDNVSLLRVVDPDSTFPSAGKIGIDQADYNYFYDNIKVSEPVPEPFVIEGTVTNQDESPVSGIDIEASTYPDEEASIEEYASITASDGSYLLAIPPDTDTKELSLSAFSADYSDKRVDNITVSRTNPEKTVNLNLMNTAILMGRIVDEDGSPISTTTIQAFSLDSITAGESTLTDENGGFLLAKLDAPISYYIIADAFGYSQKMVETTFSVSPDTTLAVPDITLTPAGKISGRVVDPYGNPVVGAFVSARLPDDDESEKTTTTTADGGYILEDLDAPGLYEVVAVTEGYAPSMRSDVSINPGQTTPDINFSLGLEPAYVSAHLDQEKSDWSKTFSGAYDYNADTHQWMTKNAVDILKRDQEDSTYNKVTEPINGKAAWYWIARGARRADAPYTKWREGYSQDHFHNYLTHGGKFFDDISAANFAQLAFDEAKKEWAGGNKQRAMYLLGLSLHHVQDLRVPQHNKSGMSNHRSIEDYYSKKKSEWKVGKGGIYQKNFKKRGIHQDPNSAYGWVDRSAHVSIKYYDFRLKNKLLPIYYQTEPLFKSAQHFSAGFIKFFFDQVDWPKDSETSAKNVKIVLTWDKETDLDAHLIKPGGVFFDDYSDNAWYNLSPDWGVSRYIIDNPILDMDNTSGYGPETITLIKPGETGDYVFKVHYFDDYGLGQAEATVKIYIGDQLRATYSNSLSQNEVWSVAKISMPEGIVTYDGVMGYYDW